MHEVIIKDQRGTIRITVDLVTSSHFTVDEAGNKYRWDVRVMHKAPRHRTEYANNSIATPTEIYEAKIALWNKVKPVN